MKTVIFLYLERLTNETEIMSVLEHEFCYEAVKIRDIFREMKNNKDDLYSEIENYIDNGKLIPDELLMETIKYGINKSKQNIVIFNFPRTSDQLLRLENLFSEKGYDFIGVIYLKHNNFIEPNIQFKSIGITEEELYECRNRNLEFLTIFPNKLIIEYDMNKQNYSKYQVNLKTLLIDFQNKKSEK